LYAPQDSFYKNLAAEAIKSGICIDLFTFPTTYTDVATLGSMAAMTGGSLRRFPLFKSSSDGERVSRAADLSHNVDWFYSFSPAVTLPYACPLSVYRQAVSSRLASACLGDWPAGLAPVWLRGDAARALQCRPARHGLLRLIPHGK
jgi:hypothetical protein